MATVASMEPTSSLLQIGEAPEYGMELVGFSHTLVYQTIRRPIPKYSTLNSINNRCSKHNRKSVLGINISKILFQF
jgi:hypothetical protein